MSIDEILYKDGPSTLRQAQGSGTFSHEEIKILLSAEGEDGGGYDGDGDGLSNLEEYENGSDPSNPDTDGGGADDGANGCVHARRVAAGGENADTFYCTFHI